MAEEEDDYCVLAGKYEALRETVVVLLDEREKRLQELPRIFNSYPRIENLKRELSILEEKIARGESVPSEYKRFLYSECYWYGVEPSCMSVQNLHKLLGPTDEYNANLRNAAQWPVESMSRDTRKLLREIAETKEAIARCDSHLAIINGSALYPDGREEAVRLEFIAASRRLSSWLYRYHKPQLSGRAIRQMMR
jgi:hypothetical protein